MQGLVVDLFAGGGGASTGLAWALGRDPDIAINHDPEALAMHRLNHPGTRHFCNDITRVLPLDATGGRPVAILHASPDCTHFSRAKGGKPRSQHIRDLAWVVVRWAEDTLITLENVEEFQTWGPLDSTGQPIKAHSGDTFRAWVNRLRRLGYCVDWKLLRACDFGAPTTRTRLFVVARLDGCAPIWPTPTHGSPDSPEVQAGHLPPWHTAAECIDWDIPSRSIFDRKKPLAINTQRRIAEGLRRYVFQAAEPFIVTYYGAKAEQDFRGQNLRKPLPTQTTENRFGLVSPVVAGAIISPNHVAKGYTPFRGQDIRKPLRTITRTPGFALTAAIAKHHGTSIGQSLDAPLSGGVVGHDVRQPLGTVTTIDHHSLTTACFVKYYGNEQGGVPVSVPLHTITSKDRMGLVTASTDGLEERAARTQDWLRQWGVIGPDEEPIIHHEGQSYRITDICMRMLCPRELYTAQGFGQAYKISPIINGKPLSKTAQVRMVGNSVPPQLVEALVRANGPQTWVQVENAVVAPYQQTGTASGGI